MMNYKKYTRQYFMPPERCMDWADKEYVEKAPVWCSVDLRDGNQALVDPMNLAEKLEYFHTLVDIGVKEIEIGFPSASETEYEICRELIEGGTTRVCMFSSLHRQATLILMEELEKAGAAYIAADMDELRGVLL